MSTKGPLKGPPKGIQPKRCAVVQLASKDVIAGKKRAELIDFINQALIVRAPFYEKATIIIRDQQDLDPQFVVNEIQLLGLNG